MLRISRRKGPGTGEQLEPPVTSSRLGRAIDFLSDLGVLAFASWTLIAYIGMATQAKVSLLVPLWLATIPPLVGLLVVLPRGSRDAAALKDPRPSRRPVVARRYTRHLLAASLAGGVISAILAATHVSALWPLVWVGALVAVAGAVVVGRRRSEGPIDPLPTFRWPAHAFAILTGFGFAAMSLFIVRSNADDAFYVNRATGTAQLNRIPVRDIIFTEERVDAVAGTGLPTDSFSALQGAVARFIDVHAASVAYYVTPPLMTFFATWALWRLLRLWSPRNAVLCFAFGSVYWIFSAQLPLTPGSYFLNRMWQGKVIFVAWLVPTTYVFLTQWLSRRDALTAVLLLAAGVSSIGMTASAAFVGPLLFGTAALALLARREWRGLPVVAAAAAFPLLVGLFATLKYPLKETGPTDAARFFDASWYFSQVFGIGGLAALGLIGLWAAPWLARSGPPARLAAGVAVASMFVLAPALLPALNHLTDLTTILRRMLWFIPLPAMVGLLAAVPIAALTGRVSGLPLLARRLATVAPPLLAAGLLVVFGDPVWTSWRGGRSLWVEQPIWKINQRSLNDARAILSRYDGAGPILTNEGAMRAIALITVRPKAVNARGWYARFIAEPGERTRNRLALTRFVQGEARKPSRQRILRALSDLQVGLVCAKESRSHVIRDVETLPNYRESFRVRRFVCFRRQTSVAAVGARGSPLSGPALRASPSGSDRARHHAL
jgi:hypothetical protein